MDKFKIAGVIEIDLQSLSNSLNQAKNTIRNGVDEMEGMMGKVGSALSWGMSKIGDILSSAVYGADDMTKALNSLQAQTGETNDTMNEYKDIMLEIYGNNFGENFDDIADSIAQVRTNLWLSGDELQKVTEYAIGFRDSFEVDINESTRSAKAMMDNFGISAEQAFNLLSQGYQEGLNYSDELIDSVNEYSVQFSKLGLDAEDMFSIFESGTEAGAFNLDKIGDAVKELSIRVIDGSDTTKQGFELIGLNADEMAGKFAKGGDSAKEAFNQVIAGLKNCDDPISQDLAGVDLLGTMWEDLGKGVVTSLSTANDYFDMTANSIEQINQIKYNSFGEAMAGIGRQLQANILIPIGEKILPICNQFANWLQNEGVPRVQAFIDKINFDKIANNLSSAFDIVANVVIELMDNMNLLLPIITGVVGAFLTFKTVTGVLKAVELAQAGVNLVMNANPISLIVLGIGSLIAILTIVIQHWDAIKASLLLAWDEIKVNFQIFADGVKNIASSLWESVKGAFNSFTSWIGSVFNTDWSTKLSILGEPVNAFLQNIKNYLEGTKRAFHGIIEFIKGVFTGDWRRAWEGVKNIFGGIMNGLSSVLKAPLNAVIALINSAINGLNRISVNIPKWVPIVGGKHFGINIPKISYLEDGGVLTQPTMLNSGVMAGEKNKGKQAQNEAVIPLDKLYKLINDLSNRPIEVLIDGKEAMKALAPYQQEFEKYAIGRY